MAQFPSHAGPRSPRLAWAAVLLAMLGLAANIGVAFAPHSHDSGTHTEALADSADPCSDTPCDSDAPEAPQPHDDDSDCPTCHLIAAARHAPAALADAAPALHAPQPIARPQPAPAHRIAPVSTPLPLVRRGPPIAHA